MAAGTGDVVTVEGPRGRTLQVVVDGPGDGGRDRDGDAPVLVCLHGVARSHRSWDFLVPELAARYRLVRPDARGHGGSEPTPGEYALEHYVADVVAVLDRLADGPVVLLGHSLGAVVAAATAQQHADRVRAVLLIDPPFQLAEPVDRPPAGPLIQMFLGIQEASPRWEEQGTTVDELARQMVTAPSAFGVTLGERYHLDAVTARAHGQLHVDPTVLDVMIAPPAEHMGPAVDVDAGLTQPTLVLAADLRAPDRATSRSHEERFVAGSADATWIRVEGGGHSLHEEQDHRDTALRHLHDFLDDVLA